MFRTYPETTGIAAFLESRAFFGVVDELTPGPPQARSVKVLQAALIDTLVTGDDYCKVPPRRARWLSRISGSAELELAGILGQFSASTLTPGQIPGGDLLRYYGDFKLPDEIILFRTDHASAFSCSSHTHGTSASSVMVSITPAPGHARPPYHDLGP